MAGRHDAALPEVLAALEAVAPDAEVGERVRLDRGSELIHLGVRTPVRRKLVTAGFSFTGGPDAEVLDVWDAIWSATAHADVMFAVLDHYREALRVAVPEQFWSVAARWIDKVDNWAHADDLARVYSWALAARHDEVYADLVAWNRRPEEWHRRVSIVSLIHYSGRDAVFLTPGKVLPLVANCATDERPGIQKAVGWVLREMSAAYPDEVAEFVARHRAELSGVAFRRAVSRLDPADVERRMT